MPSIVRRDTGDSYEEFLRGLAKGLGHRAADARRLGAAGRDIVSLTMSAVSSFLGRPFGAVQS